MEYHVEELSPVKKKISITVTPQEVDASILGTVALYKTSAQIDGFRKGKAPAALVEKHFHDKIYEEAHNDLINAHINDILQKTGLSPIAEIDITGADTPLERGKEYAYSMEFEVLPEFQLPVYEGLEVEEEEAVANEEELNDIFERLRYERAKLVPVEGNAPARDGQIANIDFEAFEDGKPIEDLNIFNFDLELGKERALQEFETLVKGIPVGNTGQGDIHFPDDFLAEKLAGKTLLMKVRVNAVKERVLPELDDELAKSFKFEDLADLNEKIRRQYIKTVQDLNRGAAQKKLLDEMLKMADFPLPPRLVEIEKRFLLTDMLDKLESHGRSIASLGKNLDEILEDMKPYAEELARNQVLLLSIAKKENLEVTDKEINMHIFKQCMQRGDDFKTIFENLERSGMIFQLRDRLICDKAMDLVYARANVTMVEPQDRDASEAPDDASNADAAEKEAESAG